MEIGVLAIAILRLGNRGKKTERREEWMEEEKKERGIREGNERGDGLRVFIEVGSNKLPLVVKRFTK